jgi:glycosyltransferase involved in cell wall biosynthesis
MSYYPDRHHPVFFLQDALQALGAEVVFNQRDGRTAGCWGLIVNGQPVVWLIDNRHPHEAVHEDPAALELLQRGALVMHAQKPDAERVGGMWLPLAATPGYRLPEQPTDRQDDVAFVGYVRDMGRAQLLAHVARHFKLHVLQGAFGDAAVSAYWNARAGVNVPTGYGQSDAYDSWNMRAPEILATGTPLVTPAEPYLAELGLCDGENAITYRRGDDLIEQLVGLMQDEDTRQRIGAAGARLVQERHTYMHRARQVLEWLS